MNNIIDKQNKIINPEDVEHLDTVLRHIKNVQDNAQLLGDRLIKGGEFELGKMLIANSMKHDNSKLFGIEWRYLRQNFKENYPELFKQAAENHVLTNKHHPEFFGGIENMPMIFLSECVCDWKARSTEFGNDLREWIKDKATEKFNFTTKTRVYKDIKKFLDLLLDPEFK